MYSGYVNVTHEDYLFYWLAEAQATVPRNAPLIVWSGGGPGCSAMEGAAIETGPYVLWDVKQGGSMFIRRLAKNSNSWNRMAHVLYVDQPRYVGFSCGTGPPSTSSADAGRDMVAFLRGWRMLFPEHARRSLIFASESYGGHLATAWATAVLDFNKQALQLGEQPLQLAGLALGNALLSDELQGMDALDEFQRRQSLVPEGAPPAQTAAAARELMEQHLGYPPNVYDYRLRDQQCCGCTAYNYKAWADWLLLESVTTALHVCGGAGLSAFGGCGAGCTELPGFDKQGGGPKTLESLARVLREGIAVTLYYGMQDIAANYVGGYAAASALEWHGHKEFREKPLEDFKIAGSVAGQTKTAGGLTWMQIPAAGHMVPLDSPVAASLAIHSIVQKAMGVAEDASSPILRYT